MSKKDKHLTVEHLRKAYVMIKKHEAKCSTVYFYRGDFLTEGELRVLYNIEVRECQK